MTEQADDARGQSATQHDADGQTGLSALLGRVPDQPIPADVLDGLLGAVQGEVERRAQGRATQERAEAISAAMERSNQGTFGVNVPRHPTVPHVTDRPAPLPASTTSPTADLDPADSV